MKSGGVHIANCLGLVLGWRRSTLCAWQQAGLAEHDINPYVAGNMLPQGSFVYHMHTRAWPQNTDLLKCFDVRPIVLIRNLADVIVSTRDDCLKDHQSALDPKLLPGVYIPGVFVDMSEEQRQLFLVQNLGPWLLSFYVGWKRQTDVPCLWVRYEEHFADQVKSLRRMLVWLEMKGSDEELRKVSEMKAFNFNRGISGRGRDLCPVSRAAMESLIDAWGPWGPQIRKDMWL